MANPERSYAKDSREMALSKLYDKYKVRQTGRKTHSNKYSNSSEYMKVAEAMLG